MADLTDMTAALAATLATLPFQTVPYFLSNPTPPTATVYAGGGAGEIEYDLAMNRGLDRWRFTVQVFVGMTTDIGAQVKLQTYMASSGALSVKSLLESDRTLGGLAQDVNVITCSGLRLFVREGSGPVLGAEWHVEVLATGT